MTEQYDHDEADTRIVIHVLHSLREGAKAVLVHTADSDVVVILMTHFNRFDNGIVATLVVERKNNRIARHYAYAFAHIDF